jgi:hypothetical protein
MNTSIKSNINTIAASKLSILAFGLEHAHPEARDAMMDEAEMFLKRAIEKGEWGGTTFDATIAGQMSNELSHSFLDKPIDELSLEERILLVDNASQIGREELTSCILAMLDPELRMYASSAYDFACMGS